MLALGLSITTAMIEMATRHIVSGTTRMFFAFLIAVELGFGIAIGSYNNIPTLTDTRSYQVKRFPCGVTLGAKSVHH